MVIVPVGKISLNTIPRKQTSEAPGRLWRALKRKHQAIELA
jgi:hypothetical protein